MRNLFCVKALSLLFPGADCMEIFNSDWNFNSLNRVEISSRLNSELLFEMILQLHVKISTRCAELKFQLGLANPRWNFIPGWKFEISPIIDIFSNPGWKFDTKHEFLVYLKKTKTMATSKARFKWTDDRHGNLMKCLQEFKSYM